MHNKKILSAIGALAVSVTLIGGTLAWFTSQDKVTNIFTTAGVNNPQNANGNGVEIWEYFKETGESNIVPGDKRKKLVQTQNTTTYDSFIRVKITPKWTSKAPANFKFDEKLIELDFGDNLGDSDGKWLYSKKDGYYYYMGKVKGGNFTNLLLESVTLSTSATSEYRDAKYEVIVKAESIQADNDAHNSEWKDADESVTERLDYYETQQAAGNETKFNNDITITSTPSRPNTSPILKPTK